MTVNAKFFADSFCSVYQVILKGLMQAGLISC